MADRDIPEEMVEKAALEMHDQSCTCDGSERCRQSALYPPGVTMQTARAILSAALAGRQVVDLPEPDEKLDDQDAPQWQVDGVDGVVEAHPETGEVDFAYWTWPVDTARAFSAAILAAVDLAAGSGSGED